MSEPAGPPLPAKALEVLASLAAHRVLSTPQVGAIHSATACAGRSELLVRLRAAELADYVEADHARRRLWHATERGARLALEAGALEGKPPAGAEIAAGPLAAHTLAVNEAAICFLAAAAERGDDFGPLAWRHEVFHPISRRRGKRRRSLVADAAFTYLRADGPEIAIEQRFLEVDRATLSVDRLAAELARYAELYRAKEAKASEPLWRDRYPVFPQVHCVLTGAPRRALSRRRSTASVLLAADPLLSRTPEVGDLDLPAGGPAARRPLRAGLPRRARSGPAGRLAREPSQGEVRMSRAPKASRRTPRRARRKTTSSRRAVRLLEGDCLEVLGELEPESVDAILTDPPYGIGFQHERWDSSAIREAAAKAGHDRLNPNEAFEAWCRIWATECRRVMKPGAFLAAFGSPRTYHRLACGVEDAGLEIRDTLMWLYAEGMSKSRHYPGGRATTLKPAFEPIVLARRELDGTTEETIERHGTGALGAEECKVEGRHPANVILGHAWSCEEERCAPGCPVAAADACAAGGPARGSRRAASSTARRRAAPSATRAARACRAARSTSFPNAQKAGKKPAQVRNPHPTVKPLELMRWLVRLLCPPGGLVLDPTAGSGTTGAAAALEGRRFVGIELEPAYIEIAAARIAHHARRRRRGGRR